MPDPVSYTAVLPVRQEVALFVSRLLAAEQTRRGTRRGRRSLGCYRKAVLILRWFFDGTRQRVRLLAEAAIASSGVDGLTGLARRPGSHHGDIGLARIDVLAAVDRLDDARATARETRDLPDVGDRHRAEAADRLGDPSAAVCARRRAWTSGPTRGRLLALAASSLEAGALARDTRRRGRRPHSHRQQGRRRPARL